ncbi:hypothetical protein CYY_006596 [Polysphondylium violaceum]|uniref:Ankyrin repeat-containing protein n=1 Tax=Polysphondylium violaceum TaxID=133409 RepID=A0A8J4PRN7_9MYCE|nr:hypothetical protein CYY_006596 [Polysphondylium violaceum]
MFKFLNRSINKISVYAVSDLIKSKNFEMIEYIFRDKQASINSNVNRNLIREAINVGDLEIYKLVEKYYPTPLESYHVVLSAYHVELFKYIFEIAKKESTQLDQDQRLSIVKVFISKNQVEIIEYLSSIDFIDFANKELIKSLVTEAISNSNFDLYRLFNEKSVEKFPLSQYSIHQTTQSFKDYTIERVKNLQEMGFKIDELDLLLAVQTNHDISVFLHFLSHIETKNSVYLNMNAHIIYRAILGRNIGLLNYLLTNDHPKLSFSVEIEIAPVRWLFYVKSDRNLKLLELLFQFPIKYDDSQISLGLVQSNKYHSANIFKFLYEKKKIWTQEEIETSFRYACVYGCLEIIEFLLLKVPNTIFIVPSINYTKPKQVLIEYLVSQGFKCLNTDTIANFAFSNGDTECLEFILNYIKQNKHAPVIQNYFSYISFHSFSCFKLIVDHQAWSLKKIISFLCAEGNVSYLDYFLQKNNLSTEGMIEINAPFILFDSAIKNGHLGMIKYLYEKDDNRPILSSALSHSMVHSQSHILEYFKDKTIMEELQQNIVVHKKAPILFYNYLMECFHK